MCVQIHLSPSPSVNYSLYITYLTKRSKCQSTAAYFLSLVCWHAYCFMGRGWPKCWKDGLSNGEITSYISLTMAENKVIIMNPREDWKILLSSVQLLDSPPPPPCQCRTTYGLLNTTCISHPLFTLELWIYSMNCFSLLWVLDKSCHINVKGPTYKSGLLYHLLTVSKT